MTPLTVGVLALQGAFKKHREMIQSLGYESMEVRTPAELSRCDGLIIPGGESTTMMRQMRYIQIVDALKEYAKKKPIFGTCAGLILMSQEIIGDSLVPFHFLDVKVERNAFGRQKDSFQTFINVSFEKSKVKRMPALFIRAPRIRECGPRVQILGLYEGEPAIVRQGIHMASTFHPELSDDPEIHSYFLGIVKNNLT